MKQKQYVAGFMFDADKSRVALIRKCKPEWQKGLLNGVGGKIEDGESPIVAMVREFQEETGFATGQSEWTRFCQILGDDFRVHFFASEGDIDNLDSPEEEPIELVSLSFIHEIQPQLVENIPWLLYLALDHLKDGRPHEAEVKYPCL